MQSKTKGIGRFKIHIIMWGITVFMLWAGIINLQGSIILKDYRCVDGEITNVEAVKVLQKQGYVTRYNYTIKWYDNGVYYKVDEHKMLERPDESQKKVWVNADNTDVSISNSTTARNSAYMNFVIAIITFIIGVVFVPKHNRSKKMSIAQMKLIYELAAVTAPLMVIGNLMMLVLHYCAKEKYSYVSPAFLDLIITFTVVLVICIVIIIKLRKRLKS